MSSWNPGYYNTKGVFIQYEKKWYCNENKIIHNSENEMKMCKYCK